jgi:hypothetical protein
MNRTIFDYLGFTITSIGTIFGAIGIYTGINKNPNLSLLQWLLIASSSLFLSLFLLFLRSSIRNNRYKKAYGEINKAFAIINELFENESKMKDLPSCIKSFEFFCTHVSDTFQLITNRSCFSCIKLFEQDDKLDVCTMTFCRDSRSMVNDKRVNPEDEEINHYLRENTDFRHIFENIDKEGDEYKYFISNSLPFLDFYVNTRIDTTKYPPKCKIPFLKEIIRFFMWPLPYKSTITVPITLFSNKKINEGKIAGYLCVDSPRMWVFNTNYDVQILRGIADGIYSSVRKINEIHFNSIHKNINFAPKAKQK